jgi:hypothetical protein
MRADRWRHAMKIIAASQQDFDITRSVCRLFLILEVTAAIVE